MRTLTNTEIRTAIELADKGYSIPKISEKINSVDQRLIRRYLNSMDRDVDPVGSVTAKAQLKAIIDKVVPIEYLPSNPDITEMSFIALKKYWEEVKVKGK